MLIWGSQLASTANSPRLQRHPLLPGSHGPQQAKLGDNAQHSVLSRKRTKAPAKEQLSTTYGHRLPARVPLKPVLGTALINTSSTTLWLPVLCRLRTALSACVLGWQGGWQVGKASGTFLEGPKAQLQWQTGFVGSSSPRHAQAAC